MVKDMRAAESEKLSRLPLKSIEHYHDEYEALVMCFQNWVVG